MPTSSLNTVTLPNHGPREWHERCERIGSDERERGFQSCERFNSILPVHRLRGSLCIPFTLFILSHGPPHRELARA
jgi:hypothetical protein